MNFLKYNCNPKGYKTTDCVIRSVAVATNNDWETTYDNLCAIGKKKCRVPNDLLVYKAYLKECGFVEMKSQSHWDNSKYTIEELIDEYPEDILVINCRGHLTCAVQGNLIDTWNCKNYASGKFWRKRIINKNEIATLIDEIYKNRMY